MFETELDHVRLSSDVLPLDVLAHFRDARSFSHLGHVKWEEHCNECAWPACYTTCDLYNPRNDDNCRRTVDGFSPIVDLPIYGTPVVRVRFLRWSQLITRCQVGVRPVDDVERVERWLNTLSAVAVRLPNLGRAIGRPALASRVVRHLKNRSVLKDRSVGTQKQVSGSPQEPTCFVMEIYNPAPTAVALSLDISDGGLHRIPFKRLLDIEPGFQRIKLPFEEIQPHLGDAREAALRLSPNILHPEEEGLTLFFGLMTFARDLIAGAVPESRAEARISEPGAATSAKKIKVMIWDLDNTVWDGTLIEDGQGKVTLRPGILETIRALDARGIVNSVASKNYESDALIEIERLGLSEYFVFSEIGWGRKSDAVRRIIKSFNVGEETVAFVDDQPFEREEVRSRNPKVRIYRHDEVVELPYREEFDVPVTEEARQRRRFYQNEVVRHQAMQQMLQQTEGDYLDFLRKSNIKVHIAEASVELIDRAHELAQRTNQMNFSGHRYTLEDLHARLSSPKWECFLIDAEDDFGNTATLALPSCGLAWCHVW